MAYKLGGERRAARIMATWLIDPAARLCRPDVITWVPSTRRSERKRGFDPAAELAREFAAIVGMVPVPALRKVRETKDQSGLAAEARRANVAGAFSAPRTLRGGVLLVDDILTSGATADACSAALLAAGASRVEVLTVARAV